MKIVYCILGTFNSGGMERVLINKANYLSEHGFDVTILTTDQKGRGSYYPVHNTIVCRDLAINYTDNKSANPLQKYWIYRSKQRLHRKKLQAVLAEIRPSVCISLFDHDASLLPQLNDGSAKILEIHFSRFKRLQYERKGIWRWMDLVRSRMDVHTARSFDCFVVLTEEDRQYWGAVPGVRVIPNANSFVPKSQSSCLVRRVIAVGRYATQKGFDDLISAWKRVQPHAPEWTLELFGTGPLKDALQQRITELGLRDSVLLQAPVQDIEKEYVNSSILAMSSRYEGLPMALLEAQSCGLPLVAYACKCGPRDIIADGKNGYLLPPGDIPALADTLIHLIQHPEKRMAMGKMAHEMSKSYEEERIMAQWIALFTEINQKNKRPNQQA